MVLEKTLESPLDYKEIKPVTPKGNQYFKVSFPFIPLFYEVETVTSQSRFTCSETVEMEDFIIN